MSTIPRIEPVMWDGRDENDSLTLHDVRKIAIENNFSRHYLISKFRALQLLACLDSAGARWTTDPGQIQWHGMTFHLDEGAA